MSLVYMSNKIEAKAKRQIATKYRQAYRPENVSIPKRFTEITTWKGQIDSGFLSALKDQYAIAIMELAGTEITASTSEKKEGRWQIENTT